MYPLNVVMEVYAEYAVEVVTVYEDHINSQLFYSIFGEIDT
jgi:hypothetical protein